MSRSVPDSREAMGTTESDTKAPAKSDTKPVANPDPVTHPWLVVVVAQQRSGTTAFGRTLSQGRKIQTFGEVFHNARGTSEVNYFNFRERLIQNRPWLSFSTMENQEQLWKEYIGFLKGRTEKPFVLVDVKYNSWHHFNGVWYLTGDPPSMVQLAKKGCAKLVHIIRKNLFAQACSAMIAEQRQQFHFTETPEVEPGSVKINPRGVLGRMTRSNTQTALFRKFFSGYESYCEIFYENMFADNQLSPATIDAVEDLIGGNCDGDRPTPLRKATPPLSHVVQNTEEVMMFFEKTQFCEMVVEALS